MIGISVNVSVYRLICPNIQKMGSLRERTSIKLGNEVRVRGKIKSPSRFFLQEDTGWQER